MNKQKIFYFNKKSITPVISCWIYFPSYFPYNKISKDTLTVLKTLRKKTHNKSDKNVIKKILFNYYFIAFIVGFLP